MFASLFVYQQIPCQCSLHLLLPAIGDRSCAYGEIDPVGVGLVPTPSNGEIDPVGVGLVPTPSNGEIDPVGVGLVPTPSNGEIDPVGVGLVPTPLRRLYIIGLMEA